MDPAGHPTSSTADSRWSARDSYRWVMLGLGAALYFSFGLAIASLAPLVTPVSRDLGLSATQMGVALGAWQFVYIGTAYGAGLVIDRIGLRRALIGGMGLLALSVALRGLAVGFPTLVLAVALLGVGGPTISIGAPKLVSLWFQGRERSTGASVVTLAPLLGTTAAFLATNSLVVPLTGGWRPAFFAYGAFIGVVVLVWTALSRDRPPGDLGPSARAGAGVREGVMSLLRVRNVVLIALGATPLLAINHAVSNWLPKMLEVSGFSAVGAGYGAALVNITGMVGVFLVPRVIPPAGRKWGLAGLLLVQAIGVAGLALGGGVLQLAAVALYGFVRTPTLTLVVLMLMDTPQVGSRRMGAATGLYFTMGEIGGFAGPFLLGTLLDVTGSFATGLGVLVGLAVLLAGGCSLLERPPVGEPGGAEARG